MIQAPVRGWLAGLLRWWRSQLTVLDERALLSGTAATASFTWPVLTFFLGAVALTGVQLWLAPGIQYYPRLLLEAIYLAGLVAVASSRGSRHAWGVITYALVAVALCLLLDAMTHSDWGNIVLYGVIATAAYRLPPRLSLPIVALCAVIILTAEGAVDLLLGRARVNGNIIITQGLIIGFAFVAALAQRTRHLLISRLEKTQAQLREEMGRTAELAAARERARIARDVHDVLAHSLTVLSVQVQALRQLVHDDPERSAAILDQMAEVLRESQAESRHVVGLLREAMTGEDAADVATRLRVTAERFMERTGMHCTLREHGVPSHLTAQHVDTLRFALQEALTNAYRHGRASLAEVELWWERTSVRLSVRDDGTSSSSAPAGNGSGNGLRGMRERAEALGGTISTGSRANASGFEISMTLPLHETHAVAAESSAMRDAGTAGKTIA